MASSASSFGHRSRSLLRRRSVWFAVVAVLVAGGLAVVIRRTSSSGRSESPATFVRQTLDQLVAGRGRVTLGATAYVAGPRGVWTGSAGHVQLGEPMRPNARFRLESVGKLWTATLMLRLVEQHKLNLYDTVSHWLPGLLPYGNQIAVAQLLSMTSGTAAPRPASPTATTARATATCPPCRSRPMAVAWRSCSSTATPRAARLRTKGARRCSTRCSASTAQPRKAAALRE